MNCSQVDQDVAAVAVSARGQLRQLRVRRSRIVVAACALVLFASRPSAADSSGTPGRRVIGADARREIVIDYLSEQRPLLLVARDGHAPPLRLDDFGTGPFEHVQATISAFGHADLLDIAVARSWKRGADAGFMTMHYLVRANELVCRFEGNSGAGDDLSGAQWTIAEVRTVADKPLRFEVGYSTRQRGSTGITVRTTYARYLVPTSGACKLTR